MTPHTRLFVISFISFEKGAWLKHRVRAKPTPIKEEVSAEFNDTSHKCIPETVEMFWKGAWLKHRGRAKPSPMNKAVSAEFNDTSHKSLCHTFH